MRWPVNQPRVHPRMNTWHLWWAWRPVYCKDTFQWVWRETVWRYIETSTYDIDRHYRVTEPKDALKI